MRIGKNIKQAAAAVVAATGLTVVGLPSPASALYFPEGDLGFYVYGGNTERYENLGPNSTTIFQTMTPVTRNIASDLPTLQEGATLGLRYSVIGVDADTAYMYVSSAVPPAGITPRILEDTFPDVAAGNFLQWANSWLPNAPGSGGFADPYLNNPMLMSRALINSFTSQLGGQGFLNGYTGFNTHASLGQPLTIFRVNIDGAFPVLDFVGTALMTQNGQFTITPIPVPAAVILFGSGLVGLVGLARRSMSKRAA
jgi:hypothetical protein